ncbi:hypothetical protein G2W53_002919 [Senna tora]|uniref:Uncharacterized protein n=1 Tax=Senna tora TaxID=362788 RepID=A0A834X8X2_9FABA|nr:hypothetical protein G2W53_002919 [Senna tora]
MLSKRSIKLLHRLKLNELGEVGVGEAINSQPTRDGRGHGSYFIPKTMPWDLPKEMPVSLCHGAQASKEFPPPPPSPYAKKKAEEGKREVLEGQNGSVLLPSPLSSPPVPVVLLMFHSHSITAFRVCGAAMVTLAADLLGGGAAAIDGRSTLFLPIGTHSLSSRTKLLCLLLSGIGNPKLGFSATRKPSSSSSSSSGRTCSLPATSDSPPATLRDRKLKITPRDVHSRSVHALLRAEPIDVGIAHRSPRILESIEDFAVVAVENKQRTTWNIMRWVTISKEEKTLISTLNLQPAEENESNVGAPATERLLQGVPAGGILQGDISAGGGQSSSGEGIVEADSEVKRSLSVGNVTAVENGGDLVGDLLLSERVRLGVDKSGIGESRERGDDARESGVVGQNDGVVDGTVGVVVGFDGRKRRRGRRSRSGFSHLAL